MSSCCRLAIYKFIWPKREENYVCELHKDKIIKYALLHKVNLNITLITKKDKKRIIYYHTECCWYETRRTKIK